MRPGRGWGRGSGTYEPQKSLRIVCGESDLVSAWS